MRICIAHSIFVYKKTVYLRNNQWEKFGIFCLLDTISVYTVSIDTLWMVYPESIDAITMDTESMEAVSIDTVYIGKVSIDTV